ncbi:MAG: HAMP domain-containing sensor histidine kinase [Oscillospiraceae bacterium]
MACCLAECIFFRLDPDVAQSYYGSYVLLMVLGTIFGGLAIAALTFVLTGKDSVLTKADSREIARLQGELAELEELASRREDFIASFAHELKTPLTAIIGYADMLRSKDMAPKQRFTAAGYIFSEGKRLEALSLKLMDIMVVGKQEFQKRRYETGLLIREVAAVTVPSLSDGGITLDIRWEKGEIEIEPDLFKTLLINLVDNARKASKHGQNVELFGKNEEGGYAFYIRDFGRGMKPEEISKITEPFYMVDKSRSRAQNGAGLGLALCKRIAELHGTQLQYMSEPDKGTTVRVFLPGGELL